MSMDILIDSPFPYAYTLAFDSFVILYLNITCPLLHHCRLDWMTGASIRYIAMEQMARNIDPLDCIC